MTNADCFGNVVGDIWTVTQAYQSSAVDFDLVHPILVGDIDGDGQTELLTTNVTLNPPYQYCATEVRVLNSSLARKRTINIAGLGFKPYRTNMMPLSAIGRVKWSNGKDTTIIVYRDSSNLLRILNNQGVLMATSNAVCTDASVSSPAPAPAVGPLKTAIAISLADLDGDGYTEIVSGNRVFAAETGRWLAHVNLSSYPGLYGINHGWDNNLQQVAVADVLNAGYQQIAIGCNLFRATNLTNRNATASTAMTRVAYFSNPTMYDGTTPPNSDGCTQVVDFDLDGHLDVVVSTVKRVATTRNAGNIGYVYVWSPYRNQIIASRTIPYIYKKGVPFVGNINKTPYPEIVFIHGPTLGDAPDANQFITALSYSYSATNHTQLNIFWQLEHDDTSGATGLTLFDFNQDGVSELVYRDTRSLRIINGSKISHTTGLDINYVYDLLTVAVGSTTGFEYTTIADIDNDGEAEIIVSGPTTENALMGPIRIFKSGLTGRWAPARKVWNQYSYNAVNVNQDLTIPKKPFNVGTVFPGKTSSSSDDVRPFNSFLEQQTLLNENGNPLWTLPDIGYQSPSFTYTTTNDRVSISVTIKNSGDNELKSPLYISLYTKAGSVETFKQAVTSTGTIAIGGTKTWSYNINNIANWLPADSIIVYLNRDGASGYVQEECKYGNNRFGESIAKLRPHLLDDTQTVQIFHSVEIDVLANDVFPAGYINSLSQFKLIDSVTMQPRNGKLVGVGSKADSRLVYINEGSKNLTSNQIDSFQYRIRLPGGSGGTAKAYIYILEDENGGTGCVNQSYTVKLKARPSGTGFDWSVKTSHPPYVYVLVPYFNTTITSLKPDTTFLIKPKSVGNASQLWNLAGGFPSAFFTVHGAQSGERMRWTGHVNNDWNHPGNWVWVRSAGESPVTFLPGRCTDVTIPSGVNNFPELGPELARCRNIAMLDRAMLKNPHMLDYTAASVEIKLKPAERDRFLMWSAPLMDMYSGDYHYRKDGQPAWGDVFMNMFHAVNPDYPGSPVVANHFTSTFANRSLYLNLGDAFNLKVVSTSITRDSVLRFPRSETNYGSGALLRGNSGRFITDGVSYDYDYFDLPVNGGDISGSNIVQVVNPYMAYLNSDDFIVSNYPDILTGCYVWDGEVGSSPTAFAYAGGSDYYRIVANTTYIEEDLRFIPPLQSFFIVKNQPIYTLRMSHLFTTTKPVASYNLRASVKSGGALNVTLSGANKKAGAAMVYEPNASNFATDRIDMPAVTYTIDGESPLSLYTFSTDMKPLVINASSMFDIVPVSIGLIAYKPGEYTLKFDGLYNFGYDVALVDVALNKRIELSQSVEEYKFTLTGVAGSNVIEVNNRFKLYLTYNGKGIIWTPAEEAKPNLLKVTAEQGYINVSSTSRAIASLQVYDAYGRSIYNENAVSGGRRIPAPGGGLYMVKATIGGETTVEKVLMK
ncbi:MAG: hypothetical protein LBC81_02880 [Tannerellaceae bacterium]|nr:hypothetical protein [Tannerellaceae bacterium]